MDKVKQLTWYPHQDLAGFYAEPYGLRWRYSIIEHKKDKVEFALLEYSYDYADGFPKNFKTIEDAKQFAAEHYSNLLDKIMCRK